MPKVKMWGLIGRGDCPIGNGSVFRLRTEAEEEMRKRRAMAYSFGIDHLWLMALPVTVTWAEPAPAKERP